MLYSANQAGALSFKITQGQNMFKTRNPLGEANRASPIYGSFRSQLSVNKRKTSEVDTICCIRCPSRYYIWVTEGQILLASISTSTEFLVFRKLLAYNRLWRLVKEPSRSSKAVFITVNLYQVLCYGILTDIISS